MTQSNDPRDTKASLAEYQFACAAEANEMHTPRDEWLIADGDGILLDVLVSRDEAFDALNARFDDDPTVTDQLKLYRVDIHGELWAYWPCGPVAERAARLARILDMREHGPTTDGELLRVVRNSFLRGRTLPPRPGSMERRCVELQWFTGNAGERERVGLLCEHGDHDPWQLLLAPSVMRLTPEQIDERVASVMHDLGDDRWTAEDVAAVRNYHVAGEISLPHMGPATSTVIAAVRVGQALAGWVGH